LHHRSELGDRTPATIKSQGAYYKLVQLGRLNNRRFYVADSMKELKDVATNYLRSIRFSTRNQSDIYGNWFQSCARERACDYTWVYLDAPRFFADCPDRLSQSAFKSRFMQQMILNNYPMFKAVLGLLKNSYGDTFFVPSQLQTTNPLEFKLEARRVRPLVRGIYDLLYDALQPQTPREAELLTLALGYYCNSNSYLYAVLNNRKRVDLTGERHDYPDLAARVSAARRLLARGANLKPDILADIGLDVNKANAEITPAENEDAAV